MATNKRVFTLRMEDEIFEIISIVSKVLYSYMLNRMGLSYKNGWIDEDG